MSSYIKEANFFVSIDKKNYDRVEVGEKEGNSSLPQEGPRTPTFLRCLGHMRFIICTSQLKRKNSSKKGIKKFQQKGINRMAYFVIE